MSHIGYIILQRNALNNLLADEKYRYQNKGQRNFAFFKAGKGRQEHKCKYDTAGTTQCHVWEENKIYHSGNQRCYSDYFYQRSGLILFFQKRSEKQNITQISYQMRPVRMSKYMAEETHIGQRRL